MLAAAENIVKMATSGYAGSPVPLLSELSLQLPANQLGLIYGRSGAGKTTLLQLLAGLSEPSLGQIQLGTGTKTIATMTYMLYSRSALNCRGVGSRNQRLHLMHIEYSHCIWPSFQPLQSICCR